MSEHILTELVGIVILGVAAQWFSWRIGLPSILLLLVFGIVAGPILGWIHPDDVFGDLLPPIVAISVAIILFEGGLTLRVTDLPEAGGVVRNLVTIGAIVTWGLTAVAAFLLLNVSAAISALIGGVLVVTGPTVIAPLLRHIRPTGMVGPVLRWEGIVIDPIGVMLTVLIFETILVGHGAHAVVHTSLGVGLSVLIGVAAAVVLIVFLQLHWIADRLENAVTLTLVLGAFALSNAFQHESGLVAVTSMGFVLANQRRVDVEHILEFKEHLGVLLISVLFIMLAARLNPTDLTQYLVPGLLFAAVLIVVVRPVAVAISSWRSDLSRRERIFLSFMAPRGIVAAAVASVFALRLEIEQVAGAEALVPVAFITIIATVVVYSFGSPWLARSLGLAESNPQGLLIVGAQPWARELAHALHREGFVVLLVDSNRSHINQARMQGLRTFHGSILAEHSVDQLDLGGIGRLLAVTPNDWVNTLTVHRLLRVFGKANCYQLPPPGDEKKKERYRYLHGRWLFRESVNYGELARLHSLGYRPKVTKLTEQFDFDAFRARYGGEAHVLFVITKEKKLRVVTTAMEIAPAEGQQLLSLVPPEKEEAAARPKGDG